VIDMKKKMRVMTEKPLNAETPIEFLRTWTTGNEVFFKRNQGKIMEKPVALLHSLIGNLPLMGWLITG
jgi:hypothetical protein